MNFLSSTSFSVDYKLPNSYMVRSDGIIRERHPEVLGTYNYKSYNVLDDHLVYLKQSNAEIGNVDENYYLVKEDQKWFVTSSSSFSWFGNHILIGNVIQKI